MTVPAPSVVDRPVVPEGYGVPATTDSTDSTATSDGTESTGSTAGLLPWADVERRLIAARHYWLGSVRPDGRPHAVPRWGVWHAGRFYYDGAPTTRHARNVEQNPAVTLTLESGTEVVIVEGRSQSTRADADGLGAALAEAFGKYHDAGYSPGPDAWAGEDGGGLRVITPERALAWSAFPTDATRFRFG